MSKVFGERLKKLRLDKDILQSDLAEELKISNRTISTWERGFREPSMEYILKLCDILNTTPNYLLGYDNEDSTN